MNNDERVTNGNESINNETIQNESVETENTNTENTNTEKKEVGNTDALTLEQVKKLIQSETDKVRTEYSKKLKEKEQAIEELKLKSMSEQEKIQYELEKRKREVEEKERRLKELETKTEVINKLKEKGLDIDFAEYVIDKDLEKFTELFNAKLKEAVEREVTERFKQGTTMKPQKNDKVDKEFFTPEDVDKMSEAEIEKNLDKIKKSMTKW